MSKVEHNSGNVVDGNGTYMRSYYDIVEENFCLKQKHRAHFHRRYIHWKTQNRYKWIYNWI